MSQSTSGETQVGWTACGDRLSRRRFGADVLVRTGGLEPPRPLGHWDLNPARLPVPPRPHDPVIIACVICAPRWISEEPGDRWCGTVESSTKKPGRADWLWIRHRAGGAEVSL